MIAGIGPDPTRRFVVLRTTRWFPTGLLVPVLVLVLVDRGFSLGQIGIAAGVQGITVFLLELPTGGLADALGRRPVLLAATTLDMLSLAALLVADDMVLLIAVFVLQGAYRALESGPLDAWYVDSLGPGQRIDDGLARGGVAIGLAIAAGALSAAALMSVGPVAGVDGFSVVIGTAVVMRGLDLAAVAMLVHEPPTSHPTTVAASVRAVPRVVATTLRAVRTSRILGALIAVELVWGFGMTSFETLAPVKLATVADGASSAASIFGPAVAAGFAASAAGAAVVPRLARKVGTAGAAMALHVLQAGAVVTMALAAGPVLLVAFYLLTLAAHGAINPAYQALLHRQADPAQRTTVVSAASMAAHPGGALGGICLGLLAQRSSVTVAMCCGAAALATGALLYRPARRQERSEALEPSPVGLPTAG